MLLFIALANTHYFILGEQYRGGYPVDTSTLDAVVSWLIATFADGRAYPMFGVLFGYGVAQLVRRNADLGRRALRRLLWRRSSVLIVVGLVDALLFYIGDILAMYGVLLFLGVWVVHWRDKSLLALAACFLVLTSLPDGTGSVLSTDAPDPAMLPDSPLDEIGGRLVGAAFVALLGPVGFACPYLVGLWAGRRRMLERPAEHRRLLTLVAVGGIGAAVLGAQPAALVIAGVREVPPESQFGWLNSLHGATGVLGGLGYAALAALVALHLGDRRGPVIGALAATGQRSMTCYLLQSVAWWIVFTPWLLGLADTLTVASTALLAASVWAGTVVLAAWMQRTGRRGPFERLLRRVTYGAPAPA